MSTGAINWLVRDQESQAQETLCNVNVQFSMCMTNKSSNTVTLTVDSFNPQYYFAWYKWRREFILNNTYELITQVLSSSMNPDELVLTSYHQVNQRLRLYLFVGGKPHQNTGDKQDNSYSKATARSQFITNDKLFVCYMKQCVTV